MMTNFTDEEMDSIEKKFSSLIRDEMTNKEFWEYISSWKDPDSLCREMEEWDIQAKKEAIETIEEGFFKKPRARNNDYNPTIRIEDYNELAL